MMLNQQDGGAACQGCSQLKQEMEQCKMDHALKYTTLKEKIMLVDELIRQYQAKNQENTLLKSKLEEVASRLAASRKDCKVLEEQFSNTLKEIIPIRSENAKIKLENKQLKQNAEKTCDKQAANESLCRQLQDLLSRRDEELQTVTTKLNNHTGSDLKKLTKLKEDNVALKKDNSELKKKNLSTTKKLSTSKNRERQLRELLILHNVAIPRLKKLDKEVVKKNSDSSAEEDLIDSEALEEMIDKKKSLVSKKIQQTHQETQTEVEEPVVNFKEMHEELNSTPVSQNQQIVTHIVKKGSAIKTPKQHQGSRISSLMTVFNIKKMPTCLSPLPPSPCRNFTKQLSEDSTSDEDDAMSVIADQIDVELGKTQDSPQGRLSPEVVSQVEHSKKCKSSKKQRKHLDNTPQRMTRSRTRNSSSSCQENDPISLPEKRKKQFCRKSKTSVNVLQSHVNDSKSLSDTSGDEQMDVNSKKSTSIKTSVNVLQSHSNDSKSLSDTSGDEQMDVNSKKSTSIKTSVNVLQSHLNDNKSLSDTSGDEQMDVNSKKSTLIKTAVNVLQSHLNDSKSLSDTSGDEQMDVNSKKSTSIVVSPVTIDRAAEQKVHTENLKKCIPSESIADAKLKEQLNCENKLNTELEESKDKIASGDSNGCDDEVQKKQSEVNLSNVSEKTETVREHEIDSVTNLPDIKSAIADTDIGDSHTHDLSELATDSADYFEAVPDEDIEMEISSNIDSHVDVKSQDEVWISVQKQQFNEMQENFKFQNDFSTPGVEESLEGMPVKQNINKSIVKSAILNNTELFKEEQFGIDHHTLKENHDDKNDNSTVSRTVASFSVIKERDTTVESKKVKLKTTSKSDPKKTQFVSNLYSSFVKASSSLEEKVSNKVENEAFELKESKRKGETKTSTSDGELETKGFDNKCLNTSNVLAKEKMNFVHKTVSEANMNAVQSKNNSIDSSVTSAGENGVKVDNDRETNSLYLPERRVTRSMGDVKICKNLAPTNTFTASDTPLKGSSKQNSFTTPVSTDSTIKATSTTSKLKINFQPAAHTDQQKCHSGVTQQNPETLVPTNSSHQTCKRRLLDFDQRICHKKQKKSVCSNELTGSIITRSMKINKIGMLNHSSEDVDASCNISAPLPILASVNVSHDNTGSCRTHKNSPQGTFSASISNIIADLKSKEAVDCEGNESTASNTAVLPQEFKQSIAACKSLQFSATEKELLNDNGDCPASLTNSFQPSTNSIANSQSTSNSSQPSQRFKRVRKRSIQLTPRPSLVSPIAISPPTLSHHPPPISPMSSSRGSTPTLSSLSQSLPSFIPLPNPISPLPASPRRRSLKNCSLFSNQLPVKPISPLTLPLTAQHLAPSTSISLAPRLSPLTDPQPSTNISVQRPRKRRLAHRLTYPPDVPSSVSHKSEHSVRSSPVSPPRIHASVPEGAVTVKPSRSTDRLSAFLCPTSESNGSNQQQKTSFALTASNTFLKGSSPQSLFTKPVSTDSTFKATTPKVKVDFQPASHTDQQNCLPNVAQQNLEGAQQIPHLEVAEIKNSSGVVQQNSHPEGVEMKGHSPMSEQKKGYPRVAQQKHHPGEAAGNTWCKIAKTRVRKKKKKKVPQKQKSVELQRLEYQLNAERLLETSVEDQLEFLVSQISNVTSDATANRATLRLICFVILNHVDLLPVINAKCESGNTSTKSLITPHEEMLMGAIAANQTPNFPGLVLHCLKRTLFSVKELEITEDKRSVGMTLSRCYTALCHCKGLAYADHVRILLYDVINQKVEDAPHLILSIISAWPSVLQVNRSSPVDAAVKIIVSHQLQCQLENGQYTATILQKCFNQLYDWPIVMSQTLDRFCVDLVKKLTDENVAIVTTNADGDSILSPATYDLVKAVELVAGQLGWAWIKYQLIDQVLWPIVEYWKSKLRGSHTINEGSICAVLQIIGELSNGGLSCDQESVMELLTKVGTLLQVDHNASVTWITQIFIVKTLMRLSPSNPQSVRELIGGWISKSSHMMIPAVIRNAFTTLTRNAESK